MKYGDTMADAIHTLIERVAARINSRGGNSGKISRLYP
jgi:hypothetical protein